MSQKSFYPQITTYIENNCNVEDMVIWKKIQGRVSKDANFADKVLQAFAYGGTVEIRRALAPEFDYWGNLKVGNAIDAIDGAVMTCNSK